MVRRANLNRSAEYELGMKRLCVRLMRINDGLKSSAQLRDPVTVHEWKTELKRTLGRLNDLVPTSRQEHIHEAFTDMLLNQITRLEEIERYAKLGNRPSVDNRCIELWDRLALDLNATKIEAVRSGFGDIAVFQKLEFRMSRFQS